MKANTYQIKMPKSNEDPIFFISEKKFVKNSTL